MPGCTILLWKFIVIAGNLREFQWLAVISVANGTMTHVKLSHLKFLMMTKCPGCVVCVSE